MFTTCSNLWLQLSPGACCIVLQLDDDAVRQQQCGRLTPQACAPQALLTSDSPSMFNSGQSKNIVDARDVALAHVRAAELPTASGRYLLAAMPMGLTSTKAVDTIRVRMVPTWLIMMMRATADGHSPDCVP